MMLLTGKGVVSAFAINFKLKTMMTTKTNKTFSTLLCFLLLIAISGCEKENEMEPAELEDKKMTFSVDMARNWYQTNVQSEKVLLQASSPTLRSSNESAIFFTNPSWKYYAVTQNEKATAIDIDLTDSIRLDFVPEDNYKAYNKTGNWKYKHSISRLVILYPKNGSLPIGFIMTIIPSKEYIDADLERVKRVTYLKRDKKYDGILLFHNTNGTFSNGWIYKDGNITASLKENAGNISNNTVSIQTFPAKYAIKGTLNTRSWNNDEEDNDVAWHGLLPEFVYDGPSSAGGGMPPGFYDEIPHFPNPEVPGAPLPESFFSDPGGGGGGGYSPPPANTTKPKSDLPNKKPKEILEDCNDIVKALKDAVKGNNNSFINFQSPYDDKTKFPSYSDYLAKIQSDPTREHSINLKYYPNNKEYITNAIHTGDAYNVVISTDNHTIANVHNHPNNMPPSPRDLRTMIENVVEFPQYKALYTLTNDGTYYAFYITDRAKATDFWNNYKDNMVIGKDNHFDNNTGFRTDWTNATKKFEKLGAEDQWNYALAYLIDKYDMGIGLFRQKKGETGFTSLHMKKDADGIYQVVKCK